MLRESIHVKEGLARSQAWVSQVTVAVRLTLPVGQIHACPACTELNYGTLL